MEWEKKNTYLKPSKVFINPNSDPMIPSALPCGRRRRYSIVTFRRFLLRNRDEKREMRKGYQYHTNVWLNLNIKAQKEQTRVFYIWKWKLYVFWLEDETRASVLSFSCIDFLTKIWVWDPSIAAVHVMGPPCHVGPCLNLLYRSLLIFKGSWFGAMNFVVMRRKSPRGCAKYQPH